MAISFHIVVPFFLLFSLVDVILLSVRALLSHQRHTLTTMYAVMAVEEAMLVFELLAVLGQLLSTYLITAGMWSHIASLFATFLPAWLLRVFFTAFTMVYKNILIPRWTTAARQQMTAGGVGTSIRAWHAAGYGAVMVLDVVCCCVYYLTAVYVFGYLSDKTLYVPYHRRRWRHEQLERAAAAAAAMADASAAHTQLAAALSSTSHKRKSTTSRQKKLSKRKRVRESEAGAARHEQHGYPFPVLARTPSFVQWQQQHAQPPDGLSGAALHATQTSPATHGNQPNTAATNQTAAQHAPRTQRASGLPSFPSISTTVAADANATAGDSTAMFSRQTGHSTVPDLASNTNVLCGSDNVENARGGAATAPTSAFAIPRTSTDSDANMEPHQQHGQSRPKSSSAFLSNLPPLHLQRRFTLNSEGEEGHLNQFAAAMVEHGFSTKPPAQRHSTGVSTEGTRVGDCGGGGVAAPYDVNANAAMPALLRAVVPDNAAAPREGLADTATPPTMSVSKNANSASNHHASSSSATMTKATTAANQLRRSASEPVLKSTTKGDAHTTTNSSHHRSSFRRVLSAWKGLKGGGHSHDDTTAASNASAAQKSDDAPQQAASSDLTSPPAPRQQSTAMVRFALDNEKNKDGSVSGTGGGGGGGGGLRSERGTPLRGNAAAVPSLPPRPPASFRIDHATGNVVAVPPPGL